MIFDYIYNNVQNISCTNRPEIFAPFKFSEQEYMYYFFIALFVSTGAATFLIISGPFIYLGLKIYLIENFIKPKYNNAIANFYFCIFKKNFYPRVALPFYWEKYESVEGEEIDRLIKMRDRFVTVYWVLVGICFVSAIFVVILMPPE